MNKSLFCFYIFILSCYGFLYDEFTTTGTASKSRMTDKHYITVVDMVAQEKQLREWYMMQLKQKLSETDKRTSYLEAQFDRLFAAKDENGCCHDTERLKNITEDIINDYQSLQYELQTIQQNYEKVIIENNHLSNEQVSTSRKLAELQLQVQETNNRVDKINATQQSRAQDLLVLSNQTQSTTRALSQLQTKQTQSNSYSQLSMNQEISRLERNIGEVRTAQNKSIMKMEKQIGDIERKDKSQLGTNITKIVSSQSRNIVQLQKQIWNINKKVALTICASYTTVSAQRPIYFNNVVASYGINNLGTIRSTGNYICTVPGIYLLSVTVTCKTYNSMFKVYRNNVYLVDVYIQAVKEGWISGTSTVVIELRVGDIITVKPWQTSSIYSSSDRQSTCLTAVKV